MYVCGVAMKNFHFEPITILSNGQNQHDHFCTDTSIRSIAVFKFPEFNIFVSASCYKCFSVGSNMHWPNRCSMSFYCFNESWRAKIVNEDLSRFGPNSNLTCASIHKNLNPIRWRDPHVGHQARMCCKSHIHIPWCGYMQLFSSSIFSRHLEDALEVTNKKFDFGYHWKQKPRFGRPN